MTSRREIMNCSLHMPSPMLEKLFKLHAIGQVAYTNTGIPRKSLYDLIDKIRLYPDSEKEGYLVCVDFCPGRGIDYTITDFNFKFSKAEL